MAFPYLSLDDIDDCWEELQEDDDLGDELENKKFEQFREFLYNTWLSETALFSR